MTKTFRFYSLLLAALCLGSVSAFAADGSSSTKTSESSMKIEEATGQTNKVNDGKDMDKVITNRLMRAEAGSKSKYSISTSLGYSGGSIEKPLAADRPNITAANATSTAASLNGGVSGKYSITSTDSLSLGVGVSWQTPLQGGKAPKGHDTFEANNPSISYQKVYKVGGVQSIFNFGPTLYTARTPRNWGYQMAIDASQVMAYDFGGSPFTIGVNVVAEANTFDKQSSALKPGQSDYILGAYPYMEYVLNDTFNLRTITGLWVYEHTRNEARALTFSKDKIYESVGLGISITRDIYLYPNIQFLPENIRSDLTNVALSTYINIF